MDDVSSLRYWTISQLAATALDAASAVFHFDATADAISDLPNLRIAKDDGGGNWVDLGQAAVTASTITTNNFTSFSDFVTANNNGGGNALPIELLSFNAKLNNTVIDIDWATASEVNNDYFEIQRSSNSKDFESILLVDGAGNSNVILNYDTVDVNPLDGLSYYRLKQVDFDGTITYSKVVAVNRNEKAATELEPEIDFTIFPNPSDGTKVNIKSNEPYKPWEEITVTVVDLKGKQYYSKVIITNDKGNFYTAIDPYDRIPIGVYVVIGATNTDYYSQILIVE